MGAAIFVAGAYWYLYARPENEEPSGGGMRAHRSEDGASAQPAEERSKAESTA